MRRALAKQVIKSSIAAFLCVALMFTQLNLLSVVSHSDTVYQVTASASKTEVNVNEEISLTAVITADGVEMTDIYVNSQEFKFWATGDNYDKASFTNEWDKDNCKVSFSEAGTYYITANYHISDPWKKIAEDYLTITVVDDDTSGSDTDGDEESEEGYVLTFELDDTDAIVGDTISLSASLKKDGEEVTDLENAGLTMWFWTDIWASGHTSGNNDAEYSNNDADGHGFSADVTLPSAGTYFIACNVKEGTNEVAIKYIEITVSEPEYSVAVECDKTILEPGESISLNATVKHYGNVVEDLNANSLYLYWYADKWLEGHEEGLTDAVFSNYDDNSGLSLGADVKVTSEGTYYIVAELQNSSWRVGLVTVELMVENNTAVVSDIDVTKVSGLDADFIMGMDISSVISEFNSGVTYKDFDGNTISNVNDFCAFLSTVGVNTIRVRVWNDPYDSNGNGYGGGNNDVSKAKIIADACRNAGMKMLVDFHCSDLWTDPGKYTAPKEWQRLSLDDKATVLKSFIKNSLDTIDASKDVVTMVQVGNETTGGFVGESDNSNMCTLFNAGIEGVKDYNSDVQTVIHVTNPEKSNMTKWAQILDNNQVDYDILATSYYPYWHGTLANLKNQLSTVKSTYGKQVMVAETSYAYTLEDTDGHDNTVRNGNNDTSSNCTEPFTVQGQATSIRNLIEAVSDAGGLGVFYWESAWITVGDTTGLSGTEYDNRVNENKAKWEEFGSGWASSYSTEYDPEDAGVWYGGSAVDNEAMFYPDGSPTAAIRVWNYVKTGAETSSVSIEDIADSEETISIDGSYSLPSTVKVTYNKGSANEPVEWNSDDIANIDVSKAGQYVVNGTLTLSKTVNSGDYSGATSAPARYILTVKSANLITDYEASEFDKGTCFTIGGNGISAIPATDDPYEGSSSMHWYYTSETQGTVTYNEVFELAPGKYTFTMKAQGASGDKVGLRILDDNGNTLEEGEAATLSGWKVWADPEVSITIEENTSVKLQIVVDIQAGGWGTADSMYFYEEVQNNSDSGNEENNNGSGNSGDSNSDNNVSNSNDSSNSVNSSTTGSDSNANSADSAKENTEEKVETPEEKFVSKFSPIIVPINGAINTNKTNNTNNVGDSNFGVYELRPANQGPLCVQALKNATPAGYNQLVSFDMITSSGVNTTNKKGIISFTIPDEFQKQGRSFILLGVDKTGIIKTFSNMSNDIAIFTTNIDINGYSFLLVYSDQVINTSGNTVTKVPAIIKNPTGTDEKGAYVVVLKGDTLSKLAKALNTTVANLMKKNAIKNSNKIKIGQRIYL